MRNIFKMTKPELKSRITKAVIGAQAAYAAFSMGFMEAQAALTNYTVTEDASKNPTAAFFGVAFEFLKYAGGGLFLMGIVSLVTARQDGDASQMMTHIGKLVGGAVLIGLPTILSTVGVITS